MKIIVTVVIIITEDSRLSPLSPSHGYFISVAALLSLPPTNLCVYHVAVTSCTKLDAKNLEEPPVMQHSYECSSVSVQSFSS
jgi:hypothetical protein